MDLKGKRALVTGASGGIGECFARRLAGRGADLVLAARSEDKLQTLAAELGQAHGIEVTPIPEDLSKPRAPEVLFHETEESGRPVDILINNAGVGNYGRFLDMEWERLAAEIQLNLISLTELSHRFARSMRERKSGYICNVASFAAYSPAPYFATYSAGKTYVRNFTEALAYELHPSGVRACCVCPGATRTAFFERAGQKDLSLLIRATMAGPDKVARVGLRSLLGGRRNVVVGVNNKLTIFLMRFLPRRLLVWAAAKLAGEAG